jgi:hypothetical protein
MKTSNHLLIVLIFIWGTLSHADTCKSLLKTTKSVALETLSIESLSDPKIVQKLLDTDVQKIIEIVSRLTPYERSKSLDASWAMAQAQYRLGNFENSYGNLKHLLLGILNGESFNGPKPARLINVELVESFLFIRKKLGLTHFPPETPDFKVFSAITAYLSQEQIVNLVNNSSPSSTYKFKPDSWGSYYIMSSENP